MMNIRTMIDLARGAIPDSWKTFGLRSMYVATLVCGLLTNSSTATPPVNYITATFTPVGQNGSTQNLITVTGDTGSNNVSVTWKAGIVTIAATGLTRIGTSNSSSTSVSFHTGSTFVISANLSDGDDFLTLISVPSSSATIQLGNGNDQLKTTYCSIGILTLDGGAGVNTLAELTTRVTTSNITNIQVLLPPGI